MARVTDATVERYNAKVNYYTADERVRELRSALLDPKVSGDRLATAKVEAELARARKARQDAGRTFRGRRKSKGGRGGGVLRDLGIVK